MRAYGVLFLLIVALVQFQCSNIPVAGGTSSSENTRIAGIILDTAYTPAKDTRVTLIPESYNPLVDGPVPDSFKDSTDAEGRYSFIFNGAGTFNIQAIHPSTGTRFLHATISVDHDTVDGLIDTLQKPGTALVPLPDQVDPVQGYIYIQGTDIFMRIGQNTKSVMLQSVPAGITPPIFYAEELDTTVGLVLSEGATVNAGDTSVIASVLVITNYVGSDINPTDIVLISLLEQKGLTVKVIDDALVTVSDTAGMDLIVISSTIANADVGIAFRNIAKPILVMEYLLLDEFGMVDTVENVDFGELDEDHHYWEIVSQDHPIAQGMQDTIQAYIIPTTRLTWGRPGANADIIASVPGQPDKTTLFCYEKGAIMVIGTAAARRTAFLLWASDMNNLSDISLALFNKTLQWSLEIDVFTIE